MTTVFTKEKCVQCTATIRLLDRLGVAYQTEEITPDVAEKFKEEGIMAAPVVKSDIGTWVGFQPDKITALAS